MTAGVVWMHGNAATLQTSHGFVVERLGSYIRLKAEGPAEVWVHYAPSVVHVSQPGLVLRGVVVLFRTFAAGEIRALHAWDGPRQIVGHEHIGARAEGSKDRRSDAEGAESFGELAVDFDGEPVAYGVGVSLLVAARQRLDAVALAGIGLKLEQLGDPGRQARPA